MANCFVRVTHDFEGTQPGQLTVKQGDVIKVIQYLSNQWIDAELHATTGLVPVTYTEKINDAPFVVENDKGMPKDNGDFLTPENGKSKTLTKVEALYGFQARSETELSFPAGARITITKDVDDIWFEGLYDGKTGFFPKNYVVHAELRQMPCAHAIYPFVGESDSELTFKEGQLIFLRERAGSQWMIGEVDGKTGLFPASFVNIEVDLPTRSDLGISNVENFSEKKNIVAQKVQWTEGMKGKVLYRFTALYSEDLELTKGDTVTVVSVLDDVWVKGQLNCGRSGLCPSAYLEPVFDGGLSAEEGSYVKTYPQLSSEVQMRDDASYCITNTKEMSLEERRNKSTPGKSLCPLDSSVTEDPSAVLKPVCTVSPVTRSISPGLKPALKPKPVLGSPKRTYSLSANAKPLMTKLASDETRKRSSFSVNRGDTVKSPSPSAVSEFNFAGLQGRAPVPRSTRSNRASLLDDSTTKDTGNLPSPLSPVSGAMTGAPSSNLIPPKRQAPPPPSEKRISKSYDAPGPDDNFPSSAEINSKAVSPRTSRQLHIAAHKQQARVIPNSHKQDVTLDAGEGETSGQGDSLTAAPSSASSSRTTHTSNTLSPQRRRAAAASGITSVLYMGGESVSTEQRRHLTSSWGDLRIETKDYKETQATRISVTLQRAPISPPELTKELEQLEKDIAKTANQLQKEEKIFSGMRTIMQLVMTDPTKQHEIANKVARSQQKLDEWKEELKILRAKKTSLVKSYHAKKIQDGLSSLQTDLERQVQNKQSLEALLEVVGESRKDEVQANLVTCLQTIHDIQRKLADLKGYGKADSLENSEASRHQRRAEQRQQVVTEIIKTERAYQRDLQLCVKYFLTALQEDEEAPQLDCDVLFGNIQAVLEASMKLLPSLERAVQGKETKDQELGKCFVDSSEEMKLVYANYCRNHDEAIALMEKCEEIPEVQATFTKCLERVREHTKCWDLSSFLIKPVQRVLKYPLLLSELLKYTPEIHRDKENLVEAVTAMTDVASAINEFKRSKDLVVKYKRVEESGLGTMMQKLNWHSVVKKSSRFNQRITQFTGLVSQTVDDRFNEEEKRIRSMEKAIKALIKDTNSYLEEFRAASLSQLAMGDNITDYYREAATCTEVTMYRHANQRIGDTMLYSFVNRIQLLVLSPLSDLMGLFQGPQRLIQKRHDKCLDYDSWSNKIDKIKDKEKLKLAKEELGVAKKNYEALNSQLLVDLPEFYQKALVLMKECIRNFGIAQRKFYAGVYEEYIKLMQSPLIQSTEGDIVEQQAKRILQVVEKFAELNFIPRSFVSKDGSRKKGKSGKLPLLPSVSSNPSSPRTRKNMESEMTKLDSTEETKMKGSPQNIKQENSPAPPQPAPRRISSSTDPDITPDPQQQQLVDIIPAEALLHLIEFSFEAQNAGELTVTKGDVVSVLRHSDSSGNPEWWLVQSASTTGYIPASFLTPLENQEQEDDEDEEIEEKTALLPYSFPGLYSVEFDFEASSAAELSILQGQVVQVLKMQDLQGNQEWWLVEGEDKKTGYVPASYIALEEQII